MIAKTDAAGSTSLLPEVLAFTSSLEEDRGLLREDLVGSLAHLTMLSRQKLIPKDAAGAIRAELCALWEEAAAGTVVLDDEEDVHMAVESRLTRKLGEAAGLLHTARSRNDQVALDLRLHVRESLVGALSSLARLLADLADRAQDTQEMVLPSYTHRQRAQPISLAYQLCAYGFMFGRDLDALAFTLGQTDTLPLGVGAIGGTSLPIDRHLCRELLGFSRITSSGLDTVGDRDFVLDFAYAATRALLHASRVATDMVDFTTSEFGFAELDGEIACGSSMMPQKRNPDVFELIRGRSGRAVGNLMGLCTVVKGLPGGYNRDLQEDRRAVLDTGPLLVSVLDMLRTGLRRVRFREERMKAAVTGDYLQATDLAEVMVARGIPFRTAYKQVGKLVRHCQELGLPLGQLTAEMAAPLVPDLPPEVLAALDPLAAAGRKQSPGGTGPGPVRAQITELRELAARARQQAAAIPRLSTLFAGLQKAEL